MAKTKSTVHVHRIVKLSAKDTLVLDVHQCKLNDASKSVYVKLDICEANTMIDASKKRVLGVMANTYLRFFWGIMKTTMIVFIISYIEI